MSVSIYKLLFVYCCDSPYLFVVLLESSLHSQFIEQLMTTLTSETVFLLTTFSNMARCRLWNDEEEIVFIKLMTSFLFEVSG